MEPHTRQGHRGKTLVVGCPARAAVRRFLDEQGWLTEQNEYLEELPASTQARLYQEPASALAVFRLLSALGKQIVLRLLFTATPVRLAQYGCWFCRPGAQKQRKALEQLVSLRIIDDAKDEIILTKTFRHSLRAALTGRGHAGSFGTPVSLDAADCTTIAELDSYSAAQWENILLFIVGMPIKKRPAKGVITVLQYSKLMNWSPTGSLIISNSGFQFLLEDTNTQIWTFVLQYLQAAHDPNIDPNAEYPMDPVEVLHFIFLLGNLELGQAYSATELTPTQQSMLIDFRDYGLVYQPLNKSQIYYPTRLATTLTSDAGVPHIDLEDHSSGTNDDFLIVESNYKIYAYTNSVFQIAVLRLFITIRTTFANMVTGIITRESIRSALDKGIIADQILYYLSTHAHSQMSRRNPLLPATVVDQIRLWELERNRLKATDGYLFRNFADYQEYQGARHAAEEQGLLVYDNNKLLMFFVTKEGKQVVVDQIRRQRTEQQR